MAKSIYTARISSNWGVSDAVLLCRDMDNQPAQRLVAKKVTIADILSGQYVKEEGWTPSYVLTSAGEKISRVNIIAVIVTGPLQELSYRMVVVDDGSGKISVRSFEENNLFANVNLGQPLLIIGRVREFGGQYYIAPEILKVIVNARWVALRSLELQKRGILHHHHQTEDDVKTSLHHEVVSSIIEQKEERQSPDVSLVSPSEKILNIIRQLDKGDGVDIEDVVVQSNIPNAEEIIDHLLKEGEIFQNKPGRVKTL
ncbi:hypothetical protein HYW21_07045 [Candidatus Woesearchaeota archaeon]|nr:hypothetical protein [Candidatus Woesearchaeota archaeon]